jgi:hypothetical protein
MPFETEIGFFVAGAVVGIVSLLYLAIAILQGEPSKHKLGRPVERVINPLIFDSFFVSNTHCFIKPLLY